MRERSIAIIGAGVAGLSAGCYAQMNGYRAHIYEMHELPGGVCTSWRRDGYVFDGCLQWLMGTRPGSPLNRVWQELGALSGREVVDHDEFLRIEGRDGRTLVVYADADRLERHLIELAPADAAISHALGEVIRRCATLDQVDGSAHGLAGAATWLAAGVRLLPIAPTLAGWLGITWQELAARFKDRFVRDAIRSICDVPDFPALLGLMPLVWMHARDAGYPIGGSLAFAQAVEQRYRDLGGEISYGARVDKILVEGNRAVGVRLADGTEHRADDVISAADGHATIFDLLGEEYASAAIRRAYRTRPIFRPLVQVSLGVARNLSAEPHTLTFPLPAPAAIAGEVRESLTVRHYGYDPTLAPPGKSVLAVQLETDYDVWLGLARDRGQYEGEKDRIAEAIVQALDRRFPGLARDVEALDVATPITWERITGNWRGAYEAWLPTRGNLLSSLRNGIRATLPGLAGFYMTGQWVSGGGLPSVAPAARSLVKAMCRRDGRPFVTSVATHAPAQSGAVFPERVRLLKADRPIEGPTNSRSSQGEPAARGRSGFEGNPAGLAHPDAR
jgi:phytoene dehydrogenase-like protein